MKSNNFWLQIPKPIMSLAPMEDVTDTSFREVVAGFSSVGDLNVLFTEFVSSDGLCHPVGRKKVSHRLFVSPQERELLKMKNIKLVAQIWGKNPEHFRKATEWITNEMDFDGIDINFGCPVKNVVKQGACSALIAFPELATEIVMATKEVSKIPVSIKTRIGVDTVITESWISNLLKTNPAAITIHGRIQKQMSEGKADWNEIAKAVELRNTISPETLIFGNGDVMSLQEAHQKVENYNVDGVMIGRGIFANPWFFNSTQTEKTPEEKLLALWKHTQLFFKTWHKVKPFTILSRFYKIYVNNFAGAAPIRAELMNCNSEEDVGNYLKKIGIL